MINRSENGYSVSSVDLARRCAILEKVYIKLLEILPEESRGKYRISKPMIVEAIKNYFTDIERLKHFHDIKDPDKAKIAGFTAYWIMKVRPIQIVSFEAEEPDFYINEMFSLSVFFQFLQIETEYVPKNLYIDLMYHIRFRTIDPYALSLLGSAIVEISIAGKDRDYV